MTSLKLYAIIAHDVMESHIAALEQFNPTIKQVAASLIGTWITEHKIDGTVVSGIIGSKENTDKLYATAFFSVLNCNECATYQLDLDKVKVFLATMGDNSEVLTLYYDEGIITDVDAFVRATVEAALGSLYYLAREKVWSLKEIGIEKFPFTKICSQISPQFNSYKRK